MNRQELVLSGAVASEDFGLVPSAVRRCLMRRALGLDDLGSDETRSDSAQNLVWKNRGLKGVFDRREAF